MFKIFGILAFRERERGIYEILPVFTNYH